MKASTKHSQFAIRNSQLFRSGSALLIVLGMLSFMVMSAVAFSIFMRQGRLPSSFLRQRILSRELVKAGLAQAMTEIDSAIGSARYPRSEFISNSNRNWWKNRVFMGCQAGSSGEYGAYRNASGGYSAYSQSDDDDGTPYEQTVSTMPFEGLAYLPPPLVNTVRYWSRHTPTAQWKPLDYDSGRYAYCAVNVSDYLDINRLKANVLRDSSPSNRISLAFLFENDNHTDWGEVTPEKFDQQFKTLSESTYGRLVSLADYNLALSQGGLLAGCGFSSPFADFIQNPSSDGSLYAGKESQAQRQKFLTDSWYPGSNTTAIVLSDTETPLFRNTGKGIRDIPEGMSSLMRESVSPVYNIVKNYLNLPERAALMDYVDDDNVPTSLALPTLERTPQLTGLLVQPMGFRPKIEKMTGASEGHFLVEQNVPDENHRTSWDLWRLTGFENPQAVVKATAVYPFKRSSGLSEKTSYDVQVLVKAYLVESGRTYTMRADSSDKAAYRPVSADDWKALTQLGAPDRGCLTLFGAGTAQVKSNRQQESDALIDIGPITLNPAGDARSFTRPLFGWKTVEVKEENNGVVTWTEESSAYSEEKFGSAGSGEFYYLAADGTLKRASAGGGALNLSWQFFAWVRILDGNGNTVDMFPATMADDQTYNEMNGDIAAMAFQFGDAKRTPLLPIAGPAAFAFDPANKNFGDAPGSGDNAATLCGYCNDPRFNWAPEDWWFVDNGTGVSASEWYEKTKPYRNGCDGTADGAGRANDLFQFVSNQGYLQSMGELQFLPLVRKNYSDWQNNNPIQGSYFGKAASYDGTRQTAPGSALHQDFMWKCRCSFGDDADWEYDEMQDAYGWGIVDHRGGVTVNPYADRDLFMAALANTPYDYIVAAEKQNASDKDLDKNIELCFNASSSEAKIDWQHLQTIAEQLQAKFLTGEPWEEWDEWELSYKQNFFGQTMSNFHDVDRKFLFSYWRQCFANNQQLFLVFVRAEPTVIGGSSAGHTPSQLGGRAVALVWREPVSSLTAQDGEIDPPHRMRILFYHQFE